MKKKNLLKTQTMLFFSFFFAVLLCAFASFFLCLLKSFSFGWMKIFHPLFSFPTSLNHLCFFVTFFFPPKKKLRQNDPDTAFEFFFSSKIINSSKGAICKGCRWRQNNEMLLKSNQRISIPNSLLLSNELHSQLIIAEHASLESVFSAIKSNWYDAAFFCCASFFPGGGLLICN